MEAFFYLPAYFYHIYLRFDCNSIWMMQISKDLVFVARFTAQEALEYGLIDRIIRPSRIKPDAPRKEAPGIGRGWSTRGLRLLPHTPDFFTDGFKYIFQVGFQVRCLVALKSQIPNTAYALLTIYQRDNEALFL